MPLTVLTVAACGFGIVHAGERSVSITTPLVAAAPGTTASPEVEVSYVGGELGDAFQVIIPAQPGQWTWVPGPQAVPGGFKPTCSVSVTGSLWVLGASSGLEVGPHVGPTPLCRARLAVVPAAAGGTQPVPAAPPVLLGCFDFLGRTVDCTFSAGTLLVGERTGTATIAYMPVPSSTIALGTASTTIGVTYQPGTAGDGVLVSGCRLAGDPVVRPPRTSPAYLGFAGPSPVSASITLACIGGLPAGDATLTCDERVNEGAAQSRSWLLRCPETRVPPTIDYSVPPGSPINAVGGAFAGDPAVANLGVTIRNDGLGIGAPASSTVAGCSAPAPFTVALTPSAVEGEGANGATGTLDIACTTQTMVAERVLSCIERRGASSATRSWPVRCPALPSLLVFSDGFEPTVAP